jgi:hypothetical protein
MFKRWHTVLVLLCFALWIGCGGSSSSSNKGGGGGGGGNVGTPNMVSVAANQTTSGINITVASPASSPTPNVIALGTDGMNAFSTGGTVTQNSSATIIAFGAGLNSSMKVSLSGPNDITLGTVTGVTATDGTPGISFPITVGATAGLGARTLILQNSNNDITTFTGALEVLP